MNKLYLIIHNVRSTHNVGSMLRSADGLGVDKVFLTGYSPYPRLPKDKRLPHIASKVDRQIHKTALGAEKNLKWHRQRDVTKLINKLKTSGFTVAALEQTQQSVNILKFDIKGDTALIVGAEIGGLPTAVLERCDVRLEIPMLGAKESFNVSVATAIALFKLRYM